MKVLRIEEHLNIVRTGLTGSEVSSLFGVNPRADLKSCWILALMVFVRTGNLYEAAIAFLECLTEKGYNRKKIDGAIVLVRFASDSADADFLKCVLSFIIALVVGTDLDEALWAFIKCLLGEEPPDPPPPGDIDPPEHRVCQRC